MIKINYRECKFACGNNEYSTEFSLDFQGHAEYAPHGQDIVCAAVSSLFYALAITISNISEDELEKESIIIHNECDNDCAVIISCYPKKSNLNNVKIMYETILNGLSIIAKNYPENIVLTKIV